jgi:lipoprotein-anchoring transpeptidase ErfK/SrfK
MVRTLFFLATLLAAFAASEGFAAQQAEPSQRQQRAVEPGTVLVAQAGDYEVFFDGRGNRVIVDADTGRVIAVQPPGSRMDRRALRLRERARRFDEPPPGSDRYYLDDPEDMARLRRRQREEENRLAAPDDGYGDDPYGDDGYSRDYGNGGSDVFPPAPNGRDYTNPPVARQAPVERKPLDEASIAPVQPGIAPAQPDGVEEPVPADQPPPVSQPSDIGKITVDPSLSLGSRQDIAALQILLDRGGASPGVIDGRFGSNVDKALLAYREITGTHLKTTDSAAIKEALAETGGDPFAQYEITPQDAAGPYVASVPEDYSQKARLDRLSYTSVTEALAERFHMDENYLKAINPGVNFNRPGTIIKVANFGRLVSTPVARIVADKGKKQVFAYDDAGKLVAAYPATIGSTDTPSPTGTHTVSRIAFDPNYTYNPNLNFKQGDNDKVLTIPPGPNGPVGSIWIALDKPTYGIHGTPDPSKIGKTESHGCVRLTNWDATELAKLVKPGVTVEFVD